MINEQEKGKGAGKLSKVPFARTFAGAAKAVGEVGAMPIKALVGAGSEKEGGPFKKLMSQGGQMLRGVGKAVKTVYAFSIAPREVRRQLYKLWRQAPDMKLRLLNLWVLLYPDLHDDERYNVVYYAPTGQKLVQTSIGKDEAKTITPKLAEPEKESKEKAAEIQKEVESLNMEYNELDLLEEEILDEAFGLPPATALLARWKYQGMAKEKGKKAILVRYRIWVVQLYDTARNKTYINVYDAVQKKQPVTTFEYEGKQEILG